MLEKVMMKGISGGKQGNIVSGNAYGIDCSNSQMLALTSCSANGFVLGPADCTTCTSNAYFLNLDAASLNATVSPDNLADGDPVIYLYGAKNRTLSYLDLTHGSLPGTNFGKIAVLNSQGVTIERVQVAKVSTNGVLGSAIHLSSCQNCTIRNALVRDVTGAPGAAVYLKGTPGYVVENLTAYNIGASGGTTGRGVLVEAAATATVRNSLFSSINGYGAFFEGTAPAKVLVTYSDFFNTTAGDGSGVTLTTNFHFDPKFANPGTGDFHLLPASAGIDSGDPASACGSEPAPNGCRVNLGRYGNTSEAETRLGASHCTVCPP